jgi:hypothetical protein
MPPWSDDFSKYTLQDVLQCFQENKAWYKELRTRLNALVNSRLAKVIGPEEYALNRKLANEETAECKRRGAKLVNEITSRG